MNAGLVFFGIVAWVGVAALALAMAAWKEPVIGFFPIAAGVLAAWAIGEYITERVWKD